MATDVHPSATVYPGTVLGEGVRVLENFPLATLRDFIDWTPFFHTWGLKGIYPRILEHPEQGAQARRHHTSSSTAIGNSR